MEVLDVDQFIKLVLMAIEAETKEKYRAEWTALLPVMVFANHYMTFDEYYDICTGKNVDMRPVDEIIAEIDKKHAEVKNEWH